MSGIYRSKIGAAYESLRSLYIPREAIESKNLTPGRLTVLIKDVDGFMAEGNLGKAGILSGMAKLYSRLSLKEGSEVEFEISEDGNIVVTKPEPPTTPAPVVAQGAESVFSRLKLRHIHIEAFRPANLDDWEPQTEPDVYLAFGVLQEYTDYQYCCGASIVLLKKLGYAGEVATKPDAILISRITEEYLMAEWKKNSSDFKTNHKPYDVDVLVCWIDDETDRTVLPPTVLALYQTARIAAGIKSDA